MEHNINEGKNVEEPCLQTLHRSELVGQFVTQKPTIKNEKKKSKLYLT